MSAWSAGQLHTNLRITLCGPRPTPRPVLFPQAGFLATKSSDTRIGFTELTYA